MIAKAKAPLYTGYLSLLTPAEMESYAFADRQRNHGATSAERIAGNRHCRHLAAMSRQRIRENRANVAAPRTTTTHDPYHCETHLEMEAVYG